MERTTDWVFVSVTKKQRKEEIRQSSGTLWVSKVLLQTTKILEFSLLRKWELLYVRLHK